MTDEGNITDAGLEALAEALAVQLFRWRDIDIPARLLTDPIREALAASRVHPAGEPVAWGNKHDIDALTPEGADISLASVELPQYGMRTPLYASPAPSYADAIRDCLGAVEAAREKAIHSRSVDYINGVREGHARSIRAIRALTPGSSL